MNERQYYVSNQNQNDESETCSPEAALLKLLIAFSMDIKDVRALMYRHMRLPVGEWKRKRIRYIG